MDVLEIAQAIVWMIAVLDVYRAAKGSVIIHAKERVRESAKILVQAVAMEHAKVHAIIRAKILVQEIAMVAMVAMVAADADPDVHIHVPAHATVDVMKLVITLARIPVRIRVKILVIIHARTPVLELVLVDVVAIAVGSVLHAMDVLTVAAATERVLLVVTHPAMRAHIQWCESPEKERSGSLSRGGRVPDFYG